MGLFSIFKRKKLEGNVAFVGLGFAGKSTILHRLKTENFTEHTVRTMGLNVDSFKVEGVNFNAFDLGGHETFRLIWEPYICKTIAVCFVIYSSAPALFPESVWVLQQVLEYLPETAILLLIAKKSDLAGRDTLKEIISTFNFVELTENSKLSRINIFYISAKTGDQFIDAFEWLSENVSEYLNNSEKMKKLSESKGKTTSEYKEFVGM